VWTYNANNNPTNLGTFRSTSPNKWVLWNVADYTTNFMSQADHGLTRLEVARTTACVGTKNVGAAFDYEGNQGGALAAISVTFGFISVSYNPSSPTHGHWGTDAIWAYI
jgi:hypothetical protein